MGFSIPLLRPFLFHPGALPHPLGGHASVPESLLRYRPAGCRSKRHPRKGSSPVYARTHRRSSPRHRHRLGPCANSTFTPRSLACGPCTINFDDPTTTIYWRRRRNARHHPDLFPVIFVVGYRRRRRVFTHTAFSILQSFPSITGSGARAIRVVLVERTERASTAPRGSHPR